jgi:general secretion pathway protein I
MMREMEIDYLAANHRTTQAIQQCKNLFEASFGIWTRGAINKALKREDGFTLLEVLVAFVLLTTTITLILQLFSSNLKTLSLTEDYLSATVKAEAKMREILGNDRLMENVWTEITSDGYRIDVAIYPVQERRTKDLTLGMMEINVTMSWKKDTKERSLTLKTMKAVKRQIDKI